MVFAHEVEKGTPLRLIKDVVAETRFDSFYAERSEYKSGELAVFESYEAKRRVHSRFCQKEEFHSLEEREMGREIPSKAVVLIGDSLIKIPAYKFSTYFEVLNYE